MSPNLRDLKLPVAPTWLVEKLSRPTHHVANTNGAPLGFIKPGARNNNLTSLAGFFRRQGLDEQGILEMLRAANNTGTDPLDDREVMGIASSVSKYPPGRGGDLFDLPISRGIAATMEGCRYVPESGWTVFDGKRWAADPSGILAREKVKCQLEQFVQAVKSSGDLEAAREAHKYLSSAKVKAIETLVVSDPEIRASVDDFDCEPGLLNVHNGTLNLLTGDLREHDPSDFLTKVANVAYDPDADCPAFKHVLATALPPKHQAFLLRYLGYALMGDPKEQVFAILYGAGANGKSTIINAVSHLLGDYAANVEPVTLIKQKSDRIRTDIARLHGVYLAVTSELAKGEILDAALIKRFTGGDTITSRSLYSKEFEYRPKFALLMTTNALPVIDGADPALARRLLLLPFKSIVPEDERDASLGRTLEGEASGILNLLLEGYHEYHEIGLALPDDLRAEAAQFVASSDMVQSFLNDTTEAAEGETVGAKALYQRYQVWCGMGGLRALSMPQFRQELHKKGYRQQRSKSGVAWVGVRLQHRPVFSTAD
ncbi:phage/plasmid primase, P4 family [Sinisalibacter lacisalsi]|uniref:SF3 helicase domain-containing protein n=1 Tax=Sinisalibacter lacisalsi TaxID=1526570 RepID=A0ABQ1Q9T8_9RHOB|nr:phage/plasmid primase, P4 family [Sinisalibacter lacisalsi]GGD19464.1 hypothetical protein GCM10011358_00050 [Sinisalibacter lacisalsi]